MSISKLSKIKLIILFPLFFWGAISSVNAYPAKSSDTDFSTNLSQGYYSQGDQMLAQTREADKNEMTPAPGTLVLPGQTNVSDSDKEKKCMTVCARWGQDCIYDQNRGRKCRRTCKQFTQECF